MRVPRASWNLALLAVAAAAVACAPRADVSVFVSGYPPHEGEVAVYTDRASLPVGVVELGQVVVRDQGDSTRREQELLDTARREAARIGANAILLQQRGEQASGGYFIGGYFFADTERVIVALALYVP
jgi:hypothetical protein